MADSVGSVSSVSKASALKPKLDNIADQPLGNGGKNFSDLLQNSLHAAVEAQHTSEKISASALLGKADMTDVLKAVNDAETALKTVLAIRDRVVQAWQEVLRSQI